MNCPTVSVVMSVYNHAAVLRPAIDGILSQEGVDLQFVIVDDGSTDDSPAILDEYARLDSRILVLHQENSGLTRALVRGCAAASGEFIARQDADDVSLPGRLTTQIEFMTRNNLDFASCYVLQIGPGNEHMGKIQITDDPDCATKKLLSSHSGVPCHGSVVMRRSAYEAAKGYRPQFYYAQDTDLWCRLVEHGRYGCVPQTLYQLRSSPESISGSCRDVQARFHKLGISAAMARRNARSEDSVLDQATQLTLSVKKRLSTGRVRRNRATSLYMIGASLLKNGNSSGRSYLRKSIEVNPLSCRAWLRYLLSFAGKTN